MDRIPIDNYGNAARALIGARTASRDAAFFLEYLKPGMRLLDCGCGEGTITVGLAEVLSPGEVVGVDIASQSLQSATQLATDRGLSNARFEEGNVYELPFPNESFDAVFSHALFEHLTDKSKALSEIWRVLKSGGTVGLRAPDLGANIHEPYDPLIDQFWQLFVRIRDELGGESKMGRRLVGLLRTAGYIDVKGSASFETYATPDSVQWCAELFGGFTLGPPYADEWLKRRWVDRETLEKISTAWRAWAEREGAFGAYAWCEAVGWKA